MKLKKGEIIELEIHALAFGGAGIGKHEGIAVFVPKTMPGDKVKVSLTRIKSKLMEAELVEIVSPSKDRIDPKCKYFGKFGGCQFQYMPYEKQLEFKKQHVIDSFERIGKIFDAPVKDVIPSKEQYYYRNKMEFSFGYDKEMNFALGMHVPGRRFDIMDLEECHLESELSYTILNTVREITKRLKWKPFKYSNGQGFLKAVYIREGKRTGETLVNLVGSDDYPKDLEAGLHELKVALQALRGEESRVSSFYFSTVISKRGQKKRIEEMVIYGKKVLTEKMQLPGGDELEFDILPQAFFQVNTHQAEILYQEVLDLAGQKPQQTIFDLFCGTGTIGLFLANHAEKVLGIELNEEAVKAAKENASKNGIYNIDFYVGDVKNVIKEIKDTPSLIVVDPPRAGLTEKMIEHINNFNCPQIIYVSCNPGTLARDCNWLKDYGYKLKSVQPVDMFPNTYHIENVCLLER